MDRCKCVFKDIRNATNLHQTKIRFLIVGALNTAFGLSVFPALYYLADSLKLHYIAILVVSQSVCVSFSFLTQKYFVFQTSGYFFRESIKFLVFHISFFFANLAALPFFVEIAGMCPVFGQTLFTFLVIISSYYWHSRVTFSTGK